MKVEEVELQPLRRLLLPAPQNSREPLFTATDVHIMERRVVSVLNFKLLPDTIYFWLDLLIRLWDDFLIYDMSEVEYPFPLFKPTPRTNLQEYDPK